MKTNPPVRAISKVCLIPSAAHIIQEDRSNSMKKGAATNVDCYCICKLCKSTAVSVHVLLIHADLYQ